ncbi:MAG: FeoB small GTPase domain-containing protein, partial [Sphaerochaetaceae bacterium]
PRVVVACNLMDEARRNKLSIDTRVLSKDLGVPVVPMAARTGEGVVELLDTIEKLAT